MNGQLTPEIQAEIKEILGKLVTQQVPVRWQSNERLPGGGERRSFYRGSGDDFDGMVPYQPGHDPRKINWKHYAASGGTEVMVNVYKQITDITAHVICDVSDSMDFGTVRATKRHLAAELLGSCLNSLNETKDRVSITFCSTNNIEHVLKARVAKAMLFPAMAGALTSKQSTNQTTNQTTGPGQGLARALNRLPNSRCLVFIISDFMHTTEADWLALSRAAARHDIVCLYVQDRRERELPDSVGRRSLGWFYALADSSGARRTIWVNKKTRMQYAANFQKHADGIISHFQKYHCRWLIVSTEEGDSAFIKIARVLGGAR